MCFSSQQNCAGGLDHILCAPQRHLNIHLLSDIPFWMFLCLVLCATQGKCHAPMHLILDKNLKDGWIDACMHAWLHCARAK